MWLRHVSRYWKINWDRGDLHSSDHLTQADYFKSRSFILSPSGPLLPYLCQGCGISFSPSFEYVWPWRRTVRQRSKLCHWWSEKRGLSSLFEEHWYPHDHHLQYRPFDPRLFHDLFVKISNFFHPQLWWFRRSWGWEKAWSQSRLVDSTAWHLDVLLCAGPPWCGPDKAPGELGMTRDTATLHGRRHDEQLQRSFMSRWSQTECSFEGISHFPSRRVSFDQQANMQGSSRFRMEVLEGCSVSSHISQTYAPTLSSSSSSSWSSVHLPTRLCLWL